MDLRRAGILLDTTNVDGAAVVSRVQHGDFDMAALTWEAAGTRTRAFSRVRRAIISAPAIAPNDSPSSSTNCVPRRHPQPALPCCNSWPNC